MTLRWASPQSGKNNSIDRPWQERSIIYCNQCHLASIYFYNLCGEFINIILIYRPLTSSQAEVDHRAREEQDGDARGDAVDSAVPTKDCGHFVA